MYACMYLLLFYVASQTGNHAQCYDDDGKGEMIFKRTRLDNLDKWSEEKTGSPGISPGKDHLNIGHESEPKRTGGGGGKAVQCVSNISICKLH